MNPHYHSEQTAGTSAPTRAAERSGKQQIEEMFDMLYRRKWIVLVTFFLVAAGAAIYSFRQVPEYEASSLVMLDLAGRSGMSSMASAMPAGDQLFAGNGRSLGGELFVIQNSLTIQERVQKRMAEMRDSLKLGGPNGPRGYAYFAPASSEANAIRVTVASPDPEEAALLANIYAEEYVRLTQDQSRSYMTASREFLEEQEAMRAAELREAEEAIARYMEREGVVGLDRTGSTIVGGIAALEAARDDASIELQMRKSSLQVIERELDHISPQLSERIASGVDRRIQLAQEKLTALEVQKNEILMRYPNATEAELATTDLPKVQSLIDQLQSEVAELSEQYVAEVAATGGITQGEQGLTYVAELKRQAVQEQIAINGLEAKIEVMNRRIGEQESELENIPEQSVELARLERSRAHAEQMYGYVVQRLQETRVAEQSEPGYAHILRSAVVPTEPVRPDRKRILILGAFFGLMIGLGLAVARDKFDNRIYKPEQLEDRGYEVLGTVPNLQPLVKDLYKGKEYIEADGRKIATSLVTLVEPASVVSEAFRHIRTNLQFSGGERVIETIMVTSPGMGEGKSVNAANLAVSMAQAGRKTLLIDADLHRPRIHSLFGVTVRPGLLHLLDDPTLATSTAAVSVADDLWIVPAGTQGETELSAGEEAIDAIPHLSERLGSKRMRDLIRTWRQEYDVVIIDTPPVLALSDAMLISTQCDATMLLIRAAKSKEAEVDRSLKRLKSVGANVIGLLMNGFDISMAYGQTYKYGVSHYGPYASYGYSNYAAYGPKGKSKRRLKKARASARSSRA